MTVKFLIPDYVQKVARMLIKEGFKCYLVGGALRDVVLDIEPDDYDLATDAKPEQMLDIFPKSVATGMKFGMVSAIVPDEKGENHEVQVTTFRSEEDYVDGRWPTKVTFINDLDKDLGRRDFTFNAMALDLSSANLDSGNIEKDWEIYDPFEGMKDLNLKVVRAVGTPLERFKEDGLRAFKACRMASQLQFDIEEDTFKAITQAIPVAAQVSIERVRDEFVKMLMHSPKPSIGIDLMRRTGLLELFLPELLEGYGVEQKKFHADDVYHHLLYTCDVAPDNIKLAALFHDIGKPRKDMGNGHFYGHDTEGEKMTVEIMTRLRFSKAETLRVARLVRNHMFYFPYEAESMTEEEIKALREKEWSDSAVRRFIARVGEENLEDLFALRIADATANPMTAFKPKEITELQKRISEVRTKDMALKVTDLKINGHDLMEAGITHGPEVGRVLEELLEKVIDDPMLNTKETLLELAKKMAQ
ncbi:MAG: Polynucleotide adenylyltransferase/metal dependent phosphohydrolase [candidate division WS6 bacterium GW2011_GWF2_39_15]|uniref:Polynucleotide adenylyltransferase/metal dependent phosphohydrolase n=1 Tax=candidate division WS6 bacterium GW2011_GWF2_39_15 TaxID=1619100 RepID=A0A0G0MT37_9BACT|nr:MAG: Polynucleotide adenylyltransferase/metal dependent phosphohydrolase [candidate division WS6 bacterium GW2011_GWF2_39_15]